MTEVEAAESLLHLHGLTRHRFAGAALGDPALVILLELLLAERNARSLSSDNFTDTAGLPPATGRRYVALLRQQGLVRGDGATDDEPIALTEEGRTRLRQLLADWRPS